MVQSQNQTQNELKNTLVAEVDTKKIDILQKDKIIS